MIKNVIEALKGLNRSEIFFPKLKVKKYYDKQDKLTVVYGGRAIKLLSTFEGNPMDSYEELVLTIDGKIQEHFIDISGMYNINEEMEWMDRRVSDAKLDKIIQSWGAENIISALNELKSEKYKRRYRKAA